MIKIPYQEILAKLTQQTGMTEEQIEQKIQAKLQQLSGLISKEGAAHIVANELGIKLIQNTGKVKDLYPEMRNIEFLAKVQNIYEVREFMRADQTTGKVGRFIAGDETGTIPVVCWNAQTDNFSKLTQGNIVRITGALVRENRGQTEIHLNDQSRIIINPQGETIGEVKTNRPARKPIKELKEDEQAEIFGTIVQAFNPTFFDTCSQCNKRIKNENNQISCQEHPTALPDIAYVMNVYLDDGTDTIRCVFFRNQAEKLLNKQKQDFLNYKQTPDLFEEIKTALLGEQFRLAGRVKKNTFFDRLEFIANDVNPADPKEENKQEEERIS
ncbi:hypothetical protein HY484_03175 [Candidatus Woesearchaeota archaeon]|nr:hypothetical protein [Candidatus Woesearchaeota archaeon]